LSIISENKVNRNNFKRDISIFFRLIRVQLSLMVTISAITGYFLTGSLPNVALIFLVAGVFLLAAGTSVLNQVQECRYDALMTRTKQRPIPAGEISRSTALLIAVVLIFTGTFLLRLIGWLPMALGLSNVVFYNLIYTPLKTKSWLAIVPGAMVGAVPPLIGWTSAGFNLFHLNALFIATFVFLWQIPHFWLLMIKYGKEYELAGFSSISKVLNQSQIRSVVFGWGVLTSLFLMLFPFFGFSLKPILIVALVLMNFLFITLFHRFLFQPDSPKTIRKAFILINSYAVGVFLFLVINAMIS
jgi:protoheme IX farnesyltransferase